MTTDCDLPDRLAELLTRTAAAVEVRPDIDIVLDRSPVLPLAGGRPRSARGGPRRAVAVIGIAAALLAVVGLAVSVQDAGQPVISGNSTSSTAAPSPPPGGRTFPVLDHLPSGFDQPFASYAERDDRTPIGVRALVGRATESSVVDGILVEAFPSTPWWIENPYNEPTTVAGRPAVIKPQAGLQMDISSGSTVLAFPGEPTLVLTGHDPVGFLETGPDALAAVLRAETPGVELRFTDLPNGFTVVRAPQPMGARTFFPTVSAEGDGGTLRVQESEVDPLMFVARQGDADAVTVAGRPAWIVNHENVTELAWTTGDGTNLLLTATIDREQALAIASGVRLVDEAEWQTVYGIDPPTPNGLDGTTAPPEEGD